MEEINGRFFRSGQDCELDLSNGGLSLNGTIIVNKTVGGYEMPTIGSLPSVFDLFSENDGHNLIARLQKIARLLDERRLAEALFSATFTNWRLKADLHGQAIKEFVKYNFDPLEPRDIYGRWTRDGSYQGDAGGVINVAYPGTYHDQLLADAVNFLRSKGSAVVTEVRLTGINGITARADAIVRPIGGAPYIIEVKPGKIHPSQPSRMLFTL